MSKREVKYFVQICIYGILIINFPSLVTASANYDLFILNEVKDTLIGCESSIVRLKKLFESATTTQQEQSTTSELSSDISLLPSSIGAETSTISALPTTIRVVNLTNAARLTESSSELPFTNGDISFTFQTSPNMLSVEMFLDSNYSTNITNLTDKCYIYYTVCSTFNLTEENMESNIELHDNGVASFTNKEITILQWSLAVQNALCRISYILTEISDDPVTIEYAYKLNTQTAILNTLINIGADYEELSEESSTTIILKEATCLQFKIQNIEEYVDSEIQDAEKSRRVTISLSTLGGIAALAVIMYLIVIYVKKQERKKRSSEINTSTIEVGTNNGNGDEASCGAFTNFKRRFSKIFHSPSSPAESSPVESSPSEDVANSGTNVS